MFSGLRIWDLHFHALLTHSVSLMTASMFIAGLYKNVEGLTSDVDKSNEMVFISSFSDRFLGTGRRI